MGVLCTRHRKGKRFNAEDAEFTEKSGPPFVKGTNDRSTRKVRCVLGVIHAERFLPAEDCATLRSNSGGNVSAYGRGALG